MSFASPSTSIPDRAVERVKALLGAGVAIPQIEQRLVVQGLSPQVAKAVVDRVLEERTRQQFLPLQQSERRRFLHRMLSAFVGTACVSLACWFFGTWPACQTGLQVLLPVACIWFADEFAVRPNKYL